MYQKLTVIGLVGRDPELRYSQTGKAFLTFSIGNSQMEKGEKKTTWFKVTAFDKLAENLNNYMQKGTKVFVSGKLSSDQFGNPRTYTKNDGTVGTAFEILADTVECLANYKGSNQPAQQAQQTQQAQPVQTATAPAQDDYDVVY